MPQRWDRAQLPIVEDQTRHLRTQAGSFSPLRSKWVPAVMRSDVCANGHGDSGERLFICGGDRAQGG